MKYKPAPEEYASYYGKYIDLIDDKNIVHILEDQIDELKELLKLINEEKSQFRYAEGKWSIREVIGHIIDTERVFSYRALNFARGGSNVLPGFNQDEWVIASGHHKLRIEKLEEEFFAVRLSSILMFETFDEELMKKSGIANNNNLSVKAAAFIIAGHFKHHVNIIKEKYLI